MEITVRNDDQALRLLDGWRYRVEKLGAQLCCLLLDDLYRRGHCAALLKFAHTAGQYRCAKFDDCSVMHTLPRHRPREQLFAKCHVLEHHRMGSQPCCDDV